jgi:septum formation protein
MHQYDLYLASQSPRRRELLQQVGVRFRSIEVDVDERRLPDESPAEYVKRVALLKATTAVQQLNDAAMPVLGADTTVVLDGHCLGKPESREAALQMLSALSGRQHEVMSAVALANPLHSSTCLNVSKVTFSNLSEHQKQKYCDSGEPFDKAGGYAIQGRAASFISHLQGSYSGVMGLPLFETVQLLKEFQIDID